MKVFVAGATGVVGKRLVPLLVSSGFEAARAAGAKGFIAQSYGNWNYERTGSGLKTEDDPFDPDPPANQRKTLEGIVYLEQAVTGARDIEGIALRHANHYGPGTGL